MEIEVVKFDNLGRGIGYLDGKIIFIPKTVPGDIVLVNIELEKKNYYEGSIQRIIKSSKKRIEAKCPFYQECGGCELMHISLSDALDYKLEMVNAILSNNRINYLAKEIIKSEDSYNYRNKITLRVINGVIGLYKEDTHNLVKINKCLLMKNSINIIINDLNELKIKNGTLTIRCNYKGELLLIINSNDKLGNYSNIIMNHNVVGIVYNDECIYGEPFFIDKIDNYLFKVSYNSFFQVNPYITSKLFNMISEYTKESNNVLDLYCGVGTLSIVSNSVYVKGVEIVDNAIIDANFNKILNKKDNANFICSDTKKVLDAITNDFDTIILDPPRSGVVKEVLDKIIEKNINKIIYVSCNPSTLARDLKILGNDYDIQKITLLDMFPNTHHCESICVLERK